MFVGYAFFAFYQWNLYIYCRKLKLDDELLSLNGEEYDEDEISPIIIPKATNKSCCNGYIDKSIWKRLLIPFTIFTIYDFIMGIAFFAGTKYPYFMWWER